MRAIAGFWLRMGVFGHPSPMLQNSNIEMTTQTVPGLKTDNRKLPVSRWTPTHVAVLIFALFFVACKAPYTMDIPKSFRKFEDTRDYKMITADGVMLKARQVRNYPQGDLDFWTDAMARHLTERGYAMKSKDCFVTKNGKKACTLDFVLPYGTEDWAFSETLFVLNDTIVLVEVAGPFGRFAKVEAELSDALKSFEPHLD